MNTLGPYGFNPTRKLTLVDDIEVLSKRTIRMPSTRDSAGAIRFHADRALGGDRDHRGPDRAVTARGPVGAGGRTASPMHQQPQADGPGALQLREQQRGVPTGLQVDQPDDLASIGHVPRYRLQRPGAGAQLYRRGHAVQLAELRIRVQRCQRRQLHGVVAGHRDLRLPVDATFRDPRHRVERPQCLALRKDADRRATAIWTTPRRSTPTSTCRMATW